MVEETSYKISDEYFKYFGVLKNENGPCGLHQILSFFDVLLSFVHVIDLAYKMGLKLLICNGWFQKFRK
jgi:hypothetical protein